MLQKGFFNTKPFNPNPYWEGTVLINLAGSQKFEEDTVFPAGKYKIEVAPGVDSWCVANVGDSSKNATTKVVYFSQQETIKEPFIVRAYCGGNSANNTTPGVNPYSGVFKVNAVNATTLSSGNKPNGIDVNHIFGAGGGNGHYYYHADPVGPVPGITLDLYYGGGGNCLGNGSIYIDNRSDGTKRAGGAGSCLHLLPVGGTFGTNYLRAYQINGFSANGAFGSVRGGGATPSVSTTSGGSYWFTRGGNSPYGNGATSNGANGSGVGAGKSSTGCSAVYFNGTTWADAGISVNAMTNGVLAPNSMIRITWLGPLDEW